MKEAKDSMTKHNEGDIKRVGEKADDRRRELFDGKEHDNINEHSPKMNYRSELY